LALFYQNREEIREYQELIQWTTYRKLFRTTHYITRSTCYITVS